MKRLFLLLLLLPLFLAGCAGVDSQCNSASTHYTSYNAQGTPIILQATRVVCQP